jgi:hypothetical protein
MSTYQEVVSRGKTPIPKTSVGVAKVVEDGNVHALKTGKSPDAFKEPINAKKGRKKPPASRKEKIRHDEAKPLVSSAIAAPSQLLRAPHEVALRAKLRETEAESRRLAVVVDNLQARTDSLEHSCEEEHRSRVVLERDLQMLLEDRSRLAVHYDTIVHSKSWRATAPLRLMRNLLGDAYAALRSFPIHFQVRLKKQLEGCEVPENRADFSLVATNRRSPRGWVRLCTESSHPIFKSDVRLYFDIGGGFTDTHSLEIPLAADGSFDVICKLPRHVTGLQIRAFPSDTPFGEIVAYPTIGLMGIASIVRHEFALTSSR